MKHQHIHGDVGQLVVGDMHIHSAVRHPPTESAAARVCPQCKEMTWRWTRHCWHCELDLTAWDAQQAKARRFRALLRPVRWIANVLRRTPTTEVRR